MRHFKIMGLCLVAVFALVAVAASSASAAEPEWGRCFAQKQGNYIECNCTNEKAKEGQSAGTQGLYEWVGGADTTCYPMKKGNYIDSGCTKERDKKGKCRNTRAHYEKVVGGPKFVGVAGAAVLHAIVAECYGSSR